MCADHPLQHGQMGRTFKRRGARPAPRSSSHHAPPRLEIGALCRYILRNGLHRPERGELMHNVDNEATLGVPAVVMLAGLYMNKETWALGQLLD